MRIDLHIGLPHCGAERIQDALDARRGALEAQGILLPRSAGRKNHTRLYMAVTDPNHIDPLRWNRGHATPEAQARLRDEVRAKLAAEIGARAPDRVILSAWQLSTLPFASELRRLREMLAEFSDDIRILIYLDEQARLAMRNYADQVMEGRVADLSAELALAGARDWRAAALAEFGAIDPMTNALPEVQSPPFWLDYPALVSAWAEVFGPDAITLRPYDPQVFDGPGLAAELRAAFDLPRALGKIDPAPPARPPAAAWLARCRQMNELFQAALQAGRIIPRQLRRRLLGHLELDGPPIDPGSLSKLSARFAEANAALIADAPDLAPALAAPPPAPDWTEADTQMGFRATQYFAAFLPRIDEATRQERKTKAEAIARLTATHRPRNQMSQTAQRLLPELAKQNYAKLSGGRFAPHNRLGRVNEEEPAPPYTPIAPRKLPKGSSGNVIVGCMKNEGPYIVEWVAYHRAIGFDNFLIYTNGCEDGTDAILDRLQQMGILQHRNNDDWKGKSPQQHALNKSLKEEVIRQAEWIAHIDVDEFVNVRCDNGTIQDFLARVPQATNVAMTWRLFGNCGVSEFRDEPVIAQFDHCAPKYCPKPHTVWGFKTMFRNIGAYDKISCHRPNKLREEMREAVSWVNGSGQEMKPEIREKGWRSEIKTIGYDLLQLNHYALRSADSFLIKRQRGRALHVDRSIGLNYWIRMDWSDHKDITIQRNLPRLQQEMGRLLADDKLAALHAAAVEWHRAKAAELHDTPEFAELYRQAMETRLSPMERVAYALALDMES